MTTTSKPDDHDLTADDAVVRQREYTRIRTDVECTECRRVFVAQLDGGIDGNHRVICPYCSHLHWRKIVDGKVTDIRWGSGMQTVKAEQIVDLDAPPQDLEAAPVSTYLRALWVDRFGVRR